MYHTVLYTVHSVQYSLSYSMYVCTDTQFENLTNFKKYSVRELILYNDTVNKVVSLLFNIYYIPSNRRLVT